MRLALIKNRFGDHQKEMAAARRWVLDSFAWHWAGMRMDKLRLEIDLTNGAISVRVQDYGFFDVPEEIEARVRELVHGCDIAVQGDVYEPPFTWKDSYVEAHEHPMTAKDMLDANPDYRNWLDLSLAESARIPEE